jgi:hypothetical protein
MAEIINLNKYHKTKARREAEAKAAQNRLVHGRAKAEKARVRKENRHADRDLDGKKLD